jgi:hypothetical protein
MMLRPVMSAPARCQWHPPGLAASRHSSAGRSKICPTLQSTQPALACCLLGRRRIAHPLPSGAHSSVRVTSSRFAGICPLPSACQAGLTLEQGGCCVLQDARHCECLSCSGTGHCLKGGVAGLHRLLAVQHLRRPHLSRSAQTCTQCHARHLPPAQKAAPGGLITSSDGCNCTPAASCCPMADTERPHGARPLTSSSCTSLHSSSVVVFSSKQGTGKQWLLRNACCRSGCMRQSCTMGAPSAGGIRTTRSQFALWRNRGGHTCAHVRIAPTWAHAEHVKLPCSKLLVIYGPLPAVHL